MQVTHDGARGAPAIALREVTKTYGKRTAVDRLSIEVPTGVVAGLIGPNGAGKTTAMAMMLGLVRPSAGGGTVLGEPLGGPTPTCPGWARSSSRRPSTRT